MWNAGENIFKEIQHEGYTINTNIKGIFIGIVSAMVLSACSKSTGGGYCVDNTVVSIDGIESITFGRIVPFNEIQPFQFQATRLSSPQIEGSRALEVLLSYEDAPSQEISWFRQLNFHIFKTAHASCGYRAITSTIDITDIQVVSNIQFDDAHPVNSNLTDLFSLISIDRYDQNTVGPLNLENEMSVSDYLENAAKGQSAFILKLDNGSSSLMEQSMTVSISVDNGQKMYTLDSLIY